MFIRHFLLPILTLVTTYSFGQSFTYPRIQTTSQSPNNFIPTGWQVYDSTLGDLNKDGTKDIAMVLQHKDSIVSVNIDGDTILTQPRILLILFKDVAKNNYHLAAQTTSFILQHDNAMMDDPYDDIFMENGILKITFHLFYNMGSWESTNSSYKFRYNGKDFILIGADLYTINRATLDYNSYSYNFITKQRILIKGNEEKGTKKNFNKILNAVKSMTLNSFKQPFSWEVETGLYL